MIRLTVPRLRFGLTVLLSVIVANLGVAQQPAKERRPNFLFILADDQRFDTIRALGNNEIHTPNLDKLVKRGFAFHNTYCQGSMVGAVCFPSRTMIMTGRSLFRIPGKAKAKAGDSTLAAFFRRAGFATLFIGKRSNTYLPGNEAFDKVIYHKEDPKLRRSKASSWPMRPSPGCGSAEGSALLHLSRSAGAARSARRTAGIQEDVRSGQDHVVAQFHADASFRQRRTQDPR